MVYKEHEPQFKSCGGKMPIWFHDFGARMELSEYGVEAGVVIFKSVVEDQAFLSIRRYQEKWNIRWSIKFWPEGFAEGSIFLSKDALYNAFSLHPKFHVYETHHDDVWLLKRFGGTCAKQGEFIRYNDCLNIPGPGTGRGSNSSISLVVTDLVSDKVREVAIYKPD